jgi:pimeloyl-ACP methyl ester carboxylesterase
MHPIAPEPSPAGPTHATIAGLRRQARAFQALTFVAAMCVGLMLVPALVGCATSAAGPSSAVAPSGGPKPLPTVDGMPFNQWYMNTTDADGAKLSHYVAEYGVEAKPGNTVIVLHGGWGAEHSYLVPAIKPLADQYRFVLYDQRGSLRSPATPPAKITYANLIEDLEQLRQRLGLETVTLMAHSMGNMLAYGYLREHPDRVAGLVLVGPVLPGHDNGTDEAPRWAPPCVSEAWPGFAKADALASAERSRQWSRDASERWTRIAADEGLIPRDWAAHNPPDTDVERLQELYLKTDQQRTMGWRIIFTTVNTYSGRNWRETLGGMVFYDPRVAESIFAEPDYLDMIDAAWPALKSFKGPVRVIIGTHDYCDLGPTFWPRIVTVLPDARLETIRDAGHIPWMDEPAMFTQALRSAIEATNAGR